MFLQSLNNLSNFPFILPNSFMTFSTFFFFSSRSDDLKWELLNAYLPLQNIENITHIFLPVLLTFSINDWYFMILLLTSSLYSVNHLSQPSISLRYDEYFDFACNNWVFYLITQILICLELALHSIAFLMKQIPFDTDP